MVAQPSFWPFGILFIWDKFTVGQKNPEEFRRQGAGKMGGVQYPFYITSRPDFRFPLRSYLFTTFDFFRSFFFPVSVSLFAALCLLNDFLLFFFLEIVWEWGLCNGLFFYCCFDGRCLRRFGITMPVDSSECWLCFRSTLDFFVNKIWPEKRSTKRNCLLTVFS